MMEQDVGLIRLTRGLKPSTGSGQDGTETSVSIKGEEFIHV
jgi:hypothetical protein